MKKHINWKALLILVLVVCFAFAMVACNDNKKPSKPNGGNNGGNNGDDSGDSAGDAAIAAINALVAALDKTLPENASEATDIISATLSIGAEFDGFTVKKEALDMNEDSLLDGVKALVDLAANFDKNNADKNAAKISVKYREDKTVDTEDLVSLYTKGSTAYFKYKGDANYYVVNVGDNGSSYNNVDYVKYLQSLPSMIGKLLGETDIVELINGLMDTIEAAKGLVGGILDSKVTDDAITLKLKVEGLAGLADTLNSIVGSVLDELDPSGNVKDIVLNKALGVILGAGLTDISAAVDYEGDQLAEFKKKLSQIEIVVDKTSDGAIGGLNINVAAGEDNEYWSGGIKINVGNLSIKLEENSVVADEVAKFENSAETPAVVLNVKAELPEDSGFSMEAGLAISPSVIDDEMLVQLSTVSLTTADGSSVFDKDDLCAVYGVCNGQSGIYVDLAALYKVAGEYVYGMDTQYFYPIEIGSFLTDLYSKKYVLVDYAGGGSHGVYDYCWFEDGNDSYDLNDLERNILADSELMSRIRAAYGITDESTEFEFFIGSYWQGAYEGGIKSVSVLPASEVSAVNVTINSDGDKSSSIKMVSGSDLGSALKLVDYDIKGLEYETFAGWIIVDADGKVTSVDNDYILQDGDVITAQFKNYTKTVDNKDVMKASVYVLIDNNGSLEYSLDKTIYFVKYNKKGSNVQPANVYDFDTDTETSQVVKDAVLAINPASPVKGLKFSGWYGGTDNTSLAAIESLEDKKTYASDVYFYAVYALDDSVKSDTNELVGEGYEFYEKRFSTVAAIGGKDDKQSPMYAFTGEETDVMSMILGNIDTALKIVGDKAVDTDTLVKILGGVKDLGITEADLKGNMDGAKEKVASWLLYFLSRADQESADRIYNYKSYSTSVSYDEASAAAYATVEDYKAQLSKMVDYITYLRFVGIYGNLTAESAESLGLAMDATSADYSGAADKAAKYLEMENAAQVKLMNENDSAHDLAFYNEQILGYIKGYLGESSVGSATTLKEFLFDGNMSLSIGFDNALVLTLSRGGEQLVKLTVTAGIVKIEEVTKVDINRFSDPIDFRSWEMSLIDLKTADGQSVDTSDWSNDKILRFSTLSIVDGENHKITFEGVEYSYNPDNTQFMAKVVYELMMLNLKLSGQQQ